MSSADPHSSIAIIGLTIRAPGAPDAERFWHNLAEGLESIIPLSEQDVREVHGD
ncbi:MAG: beta-ketoacyl synthase N-terminal-like domain-containing protein, partial [Archangium sp.]